MADQPVVVGMTLDQFDEACSLVSSLGAVSDALSNTGQLMGPSSLPILGHMMFEAAWDLRAILDQVYSQKLPKTEAD